MTADVIPAPRRTEAELMTAIQNAGEQAYNELDIDDGDCGCDTCIVREILEAAWPLMLELARNEVATGEPAPGEYAEAGHG